MTQTDAIIIRGLDDDKLQALQNQLDAQAVAGQKFQELQQQLQAQQLIGQTITSAIAAELDSIARGAGLDPAGYSLSIGEGGMVLAEKNIDEG